MLRVLWRSFRYPVSSWMGAVGLVIFPLALCLAAGLAGMDNAFEEGYFEALAKMASLFLAIPVLVLANRPIAGEAREGTLLLALMQPVSRSSYFTGRVLGTGLFATLYFALCMGGLYGTLVWLTRQAPPAFNPYEDGFRLMPGTQALLLFLGLSFLSVIFSLTALAPLSSSRFGHVALWFGLWFMVHQARELDASRDLAPFLKAALFPLLEILAPFLTGASEGLVREAALGPWYMGKALAQWGLGIGLAYAGGVWAFSRMEVGMRR